MHYQFSSINVKNMNFDVFCSANRQGCNTLAISVCIQNGWHWEPFLLYSVIYMYPVFKLFLAIKKERLL